MFRHLLLGFQNQSLEPIHVPKLRITFADFPYLHFRTRLEATHLGDLMRIIGTISHDPAPTIPCSMTVECDQATTKVIESSPVTTSPSYSFPWWTDNLRQINLFNWLGRLQRRDNSPPGIQRRQISRLRYRELTKWNLSQSQTGWEY